MALYTNSADVSGILPPEYNALIVAPVERDALAFNPLIATVVRTESTSFIIPVVLEDAGAAWVAEGAEITPDDPSLGELTIIPRKVAGLTVISREIALDSSPAAQKIVGDGLARSIVSQVDAAFMGNLGGSAPAGLASLAGFTPVDTNGALTTLDVFAEAISKAELVGSNLTAFIVHPTDALTIAKLKEGTASNRPLLEDPRVIFGVPIIVTAKATAGILWGVDASRNITVLREDTNVAVSDQAYFSSDRVGVRATMRIGFGFPTAASVVKLYDAA
jgi:HK97 family phage major capsid protein